MATRGSGQAVGTLPLLKCTYSDCQKHFETVKDMKSHKKYTDEHDYCKPCDIDFKDWESFTQHKVSLMVRFALCTITWVSHILADG